MRTAEALSNFQEAMQELGANLHRILDGIKDKSELTMEDLAMMKGVPELIFQTAEIFAKFMRGEIGRELTPLEREGLNRDYLGFCEEATRYAMAIRFLVFEDMIQASTWEGAGRSPVPGTYYH